MTMRFAASGLLLSFDVLLDCTCKSSSPVMYVVPTVVGGGVRGETKWGQESMSEALLPPFSSTPAFAASVIPGQKVICPTRQKKASQAHASPDADGRSPFPSGQVDL